MKLLHNLKKIYKKNINNIALNYDNKKVTYHQFCTEVLNVSSFLTMSGLFKAINLVIIKIPATFAMISKISKAL